jgi:hypothetical protein
LFTLAMMRCLEDIHFDGPVAFLRSVGLGGLGGLGGLLCSLQQAHADLVASVICVDQAKKRKEVMN